MGDGLSIVGKPLRPLATHRRRIKTEEKAKVVAAVWGAEFTQFLARLAILPRTILENRMNSSFSFKSSWAIHHILQIVSVQNS